MNMENSNIKVLVLMKGNVGEEVIKLKEGLSKAFEKDAPEKEASIYPNLTSNDEFDIDTETALRAWQSSVGLVADGIAGPRTFSALGIWEPPKLAVRVDTAFVAKLFPFTKTSNIVQNLPYVTSALAAFGLTDINMISVALGTIRAETESFVPIAELPSHFNTLPGQAAFSAYGYDTKLGKSLGNKNPGDGARFRGRGYVQLTGRYNYEKYGEILEILLADNPESASSPEVAACLLAAYLNVNRERLTKALAKDDLKAARKVVNGGIHGLDRFSDTFRKAQKAWAAAKPLVGAAAEIPAATIFALPANLNVTRDPADLRDRHYMPPPRSLPQIFPADNHIERFMGVYTQAGLILDQGQEGACTGFGLACVINYLRWQAEGKPTEFESVSPRMLYHFARFFDEYEGEDYNGSSCRGALKGWHYNGVCRETKWPYMAGEDAVPLSGWDRDALEQTLGVYYRIDPLAITDMQAAIMEVGAIYVSSYTHKGWQQIINKITTPTCHADLPVIDFDGKPSRSGGHAFALVGFNRSGFIIQNSWGDKWGAGGFAVIGYADWMTHAMDVWVTAMGVPGIVSGRLNASGRISTSAGAALANINWWDKGTAYQHSVVLGNDGHVHRYDKLDGVTRTLQNQACVLPDSWFRQTSHDKKRLVLYVHGGLNSEDDAIQRVRAMGRYFMGNGCYPLFLVWKSGLLESIANILAEKFSEGAATRAEGFGDWITDRFSDPIIEKTIGRPFARPLWCEMKENAVLAGETGRGGDQLTDAIQSLNSSWGDKFELHLIGHSAGSIVLGKLLDNLAQKHLTDKVKSVHLYAPACTVAFANRHYAPHAEIMNNLYLDILSDQREQEDDVAKIYRKSLLYFVSNALEADLRTPVLGLENIFDFGYSSWGGSSSSTEALTNWCNAAKISMLYDRLTIHNNQKIITRRGKNATLSEKRENATHGGFDNNVEVIGKTLELITGAQLTLPVDDLVGF
jgi:hypothetical protein